MSIRWRDAANVQRTAGAAYIRDSGGAQRTIDQIRVRDGTGAYKEVFKQGIRLAATPDSAFGSSSSKTGPVYTNTVTVGVAGGTPPYSHSWVGSADISPASPTNASTPFIGNPPAFSGEIVGTATDTVTDANGITNSITIDVDITRDF